MKIAILGGSFDPPHLGHLLIARQVLRLLALDQVWLMPNYSHAFNKKLSSPDKRYAMCQLLEEKDKIIASDFEIKKKGISYSYQTLQQLKKAYPQHEFSWIIGSDQLDLFTKWHDWQKLLEKEKLIFVPRDNRGKEIKNQLLKLTNKKDLSKNILLITQIKPINISSTLIREKIRLKIPIIDFVPPAVVTALKPQEEIIEITGFIKKTLNRTHHQKVVLGLSGGIDSAVCLYLLQQVVAPKNIFVVHSHYSKEHIEDAREILKQTRIPQKNINFVSIEPLVERFVRTSKVDNKVRLGNIMARVRMILLYDLAKKEQALVCGTENKSEHYLGYFTRFGDAASDLEPIQHLYKTQVYELAKHLKIPLKIIQKPPTAGLWKNQTDEEELGFSYAQADQVIQLHFELKKTVREIVDLGFSNAPEIIKKIADNRFKQEVPYTL